MKILVLALPVIVWGVETMPKTVQKKCQAAIAGDYEEK